jgi:excisionase family DNA binding protein
MEVIRTDRNEETFLSLSETARMLNVSDRTIHRWIQDGRLPAYKPGRAYRFRISDIEAFLEEHRGVPLGWQTAREEAQRLRETGRLRMEEALDAWRANKERGEAYATRRHYLDAMGALLQQAYDAVTALVEASSGPRLADEWPEIQKADRFYFDLWRLVQDAGLSIRTGGEEAAAEHEATVEHVQTEARPVTVE